MGVNVLPSSHGFDSLWEGEDGLSVVVVAQDEEERIGDCLASVAWADEIVVVDGGSADCTVEICREQGATVYERPWAGYAEQWGWALRQAAGPWLLMLAADERVSPELGLEIEELFASGPSCLGYYVPIRNHLGGRWMRYAGLYPDYHLRLFRQGRWRLIGQVHERVEVDGPVGHLRGDIVHYTYRDLGDYLGKIVHYGALEAEERWARGERARWFDFLKPPVLFLKLYVVQQGWRDGVLGLVNSVFLAFALFVRYARLWEKEGG